MSGDDGTYAPKSPDLSSFFSSSAPSQSQSWGASPHQPSQTQILQQARPHQLQLQHQHQHQQLHQQQQPPQQQQQQHQQLHLQPPSYYSPSTHAGAAPAHHPQTSNPLTASYQVQQQQQQQQQLYSPTSQLAGQSQSQPFYGLQAPPVHQQLYQPYGEPQFQQPQQHQQRHPHQHQHPHPPAPSPQPLPYSQPQYDPASAVFGSSSQPEDLLQAPAETMPPRKSAAQAAQKPAIAPSPVRTKFPTARIKRIMQADEEVGKVAQQTPIAVGKALELFMIELVTKSADVARERNSKRVTAQMLKHVIDSDDQWDFLREKAAKVESDEKAGKGAGRAKAESDSEEEAAEKKKGKGVRKRKA